MPLVVVPSMASFDVLTMAAKNCSAPRASKVSDAVATALRFVIRTVTLTASDDAATCVRPVGQGDRRSEGRGFGGRH